MRIYAPAVVALTDAETGRACAVNVLHVEMIDDVGSRGAEITFGSGATVRVSERYSDVIAAFGGRAFRESRRKSR